MSQSKSIATPQVLMLMPSDPWSEWTMSGISRRLCEELRRRNALFGAADPMDLRPRSLLGPSAMDRLTQLLQRQARRLYPKAPKRWQREGEGKIGNLLARLPSDTPVVYAFHSPEVEPSLKVRRFRLMDLALPDAVRTGSYGFTNIDEATYKSLWDNQYRTIHASDGVLTLSSYAADSIAREFGYDRTRIFPIGCGSAIRFGRAPSTERERYRRGEVLFVGRDWDRKGGPLLLEAFDRAKRTLPHATLTIVGPDENPAPGRVDVNFLGFLAKDKDGQARQLQDVFLGASVFCMPSVCETWGLVYSEAAMAGLPIAGLHEWALPDIVVHGTTGVLARERTPDALARAIVDVLADPSKASAMGRDARAYVSEYLTWPAVADRMLYAVSTVRQELVEPRWLAGDSIRVSPRRQLTTDALA